MIIVKKVLNTIVNWLFMIVVTLFVVTMVRNVVFMPFQVEGHSMDQTLANGEHMFLWKLGTIDRFDIVVFPDPRGSGAQYVKRLIGLPGDTLSVAQDVLYINGIGYEEPYLNPLKSMSEQPFTEDFDLYHTVGETVIPEGYYFVMGDNRPGSGDSRQFGLVPIESVEGEAHIIYLPLQQMRRVPTYQLNESLGIIDTKQ